MQEAPPTLGLVPNPCAEGRQPAGGDMLRHPIRLDNQVVRPSWASLSEEDPRRTGQGAKHAEVGGVSDTQIREPVAGTLTS